MGGIVKGEEGVGKSTSSGWVVGGMGEGEEGEGAATMSRGAHSPSLHQCPGPQEVPSRAGPALW